MVIGKDNFNLRIGPCFRSQVSYNIYILDDLEEDKN